jgi:hypothetical protein
MSFRHVNITQLDLFEDDDIEVIEQMQEAMLNNE